VLRRLPASKSFAVGVGHGLPSSIVDIVELDAAALADDAVMRDYYDLTRRAELLGREQAPFWTFDEFVGGFRSEASGSSSSRRTTTTG
jgi:hypothetical protein